MKHDPWIYCPVCGHKTRTRVRPDTEARNLPVYCAKCKNESIIDIKAGQVVGSDK